MQSRSVRQLSQNLPVPVAAAQEPLRGAQEPVVHLKPVPQSASVAHTATQLPPFAQDSGMHELSARLHTLPHAPPWDTKHIRNVRSHWRPAPHGCPAAHDHYPGLACKQDSDCFLGETCQNLVCAGMDMSVPTDMAFPKFDFARPDLLDSDGDQPMPDLTGGGDM